MTNNTEDPEPWVGTFQGVDYSATSYDWETVTIEFELQESPAETLEINARDGKSDKCCSISLI